MIRTSVGAGELEEFGVFAPFRDDTRVYVTLPGGERQGFTFKPKPLAPPEGSGKAGEIAAALVFNAGLAQPAFEPDPGVFSTLELSTPFTVVRNEDGEYTDPTRIPFNPRSTFFQIQTFHLSLNSLMNRRRGRSGGRAARAPSPVGDPQ